MENYIASEVIQLMVKNDIPIKGSNVLMIGITAEENSRSIEHSTAIEIYRALVAHGLNVDVYDPWASITEVHHAYGFFSKTSLDEVQYDAIVIAVGHKTCQSLPIESLKKPNAVIYDPKGLIV